MALFINKVYSIYIPIFWLGGYCLKNLIIFAICEQC